MPSITDTINNSNSHYHPNKSPTNCSIASTSTINPASTHSIFPYRCSPAVAAHAASTSSVEIGAGRLGFGLGVARKAVISYSRAVVRTGG